MFFWKYQIGLCQYYIFKKTFLYQETTILLQGNQYPNIWKNKGRIAYFASFKEDIGINEIVYNKIQTSVNNLIIG